VVLGLKAESRWCLSGTPPVGAFGDIKDTAALLGTNLGSDEQPRFTKAEITKARQSTAFEPPQARVNLRGFRPSCP